MMDALSAQELCPPSLEEMQVRRVVDVPREVGVLIIDANREAM
jgi:hypothetical protein